MASKSAFISSSSKVIRSRSTFPSSQAQNALAILLGKLPGEIDALLQAFEEDFAATCDPFVRGMFVETTPPELVERVAADMCGGPPEVGAALMRAYVDFDLPGAFREAEVPIRTVNSDLWPTDVEGNRELADFGLTLLEGRGHFLMQEAPGELAAAMIDAALTIVTAVPDGTASGSEG